MPNSASAAKRVRQSAKRQSRNRWRKRQIKDQTKAFLKAVHDHDVEKAETEFRKACGLLDKIARYREVNPDRSEFYDGLEDVVAGVNDSKFARWLMRRYQKKGIKARRRSRASPTKNWFLSAPGSRT